VARREDPVHIRTETKEGDVAEIEQAGEADDDVQSEREQRINQRDQPIAEEVSFASDEREDRRGNREQQEPSADR